MVHTIKEGFAFVAPFGGGKDVFLHKSELAPGDFARLTNETILTFRTLETDKGIQATDVEFVTAPA